MLGVPYDSAEHDRMGDLRLAARLLWKSPAFAVACIALIAIGVAACIAAFSLIAMVFMRSPYPDADRLVVPYQLIPRGATGQVDTIPWSYQQALDLGRR